MAKETKNTNVTTTTTRPWYGGEVAAIDLYDRAYRDLERAPAYYGNQAFTGLTPQQELAMGLIQQRAMGGSPYEQAGQHYLTQALGQGQVDLSQAALAAQNMTYGAPAAQHQLQQSFGYSPFGFQSLANTAQGGMLGANPYLDQQFNQAANNVSRRFQQTVMPGINSTFGGAGRTGSNAHRQAVSNAGNDLATQLSGMGAQLYGGAYQQERGLQQQSAQQLAGFGQSGAGMLQQGALSGIGQLGDLYGGIDQSQARAAGYMPSMSAMEYGNLDRLMGVGSSLQEQANQFLQDDIRRYDYYANWDRNQLDRYSSLLTGNNIGSGAMNSTLTGPPPQQGSRAGKAIGGMLTGGMAGASFGWPGMIIGGGAGLVGGLLG